MIDKIGRIMFEQKLLSRVGVKACGCVYRVEFVWTVHRFPEDVVLVEAELCEWHRDNFSDSDKNVWFETYRKDLNHALESLKEV